MDAQIQAVPASPISQHRCPEFNRIDFYKKLVTIVLKKIPWVTHYDKRKWKALDMLLVLKYAWIREFSIDVASNRLNAKLYQQLGISKYFFADGRASRLVPHQTSVNEWLANFLLAQIDQIMQYTLETMLLRARAMRSSRFRQVIMDFDFTYQGYWGKRRDPYIIGSQTVKGTKFIRHYHGVLIHASGMSLFCALDHTPKN